jgi:hypothetical protein
MNQRPAFKVPLQTELWFHLRRYEQPHTIGGPVEQQKTDERLVVARSSSGDDDDFCSGRPNSSSDDLRADAAAMMPSPVPSLVRQGRAEGRRVGGRSVGGPAISSAEEPLPAAVAEGSAGSGSEATWIREPGTRQLSAPRIVNALPPPSLREGAGRRPRSGRPRLGTLPSPALMMKILEAEGGAGAATRLAFPCHRTGGHRLG